MVGCALASPEAVATVTVPEARPPWSGGVTMRPSSHAIPLIPAVRICAIEGSTSRATPAKYFAMLSSDRRSVRLASCSSSVSDGSGAGSEECPGADPATRRSE